MVVNQNTFSVALLGDAGVGKTVYLEKIMGNAFQPAYIPTVGIEVHHFKTLFPEHGEVEFLIMEYSGQEKYSLVHDQQSGSHIGAYDCAIIMYDNTSLRSCKNVGLWEREIKRIWGEDIPVIVIRNKTDIGDGHAYQGPLECLGVSTKLHMGLLFPFIRLADMLNS